MTSPTDMWKHLTLALLLIPAIACGQQTPTPKVALNEADFRDKVYACWLGKNIGGTLGVPVEGRREMHSFTFYTPVPTKPLANDDLDLQLLWLKALQERGPHLNARVLGEYWLKYVPVDWNEYGVGKRNMRDGFLPPLSGQFRNERWRDSNGAWIRSEVWACLAPGCPSLAARYAYEDACVDHGAAEGTYAELFTASIESAAFVETDRNRLLKIGLSYIPPQCAVAKSIHAALEAHRSGLDLKAAREAVIDASKSTGWFMAPQNVAFTILGWLYGESDFGKSICAAVNCGDDTDCTGATLGSLLGIIGGTKSIPENWRKPVGDGIVNVAIAGYRPPQNVGEFTEQTVQAAKEVLIANDAPVQIRPDAPSDADAAAKLKLTDAEVARSLWARSPYQLAYNFGCLRATLDLIEDPILVPTAPRKIRLMLLNPTDRAREITVAWHTTPELIVQSDAAPVQLPARMQSPAVREATVTAAPTRNTIVHGSVELLKGGTSLGTIPFAFLLKPSVDPKDVALARLGAKATSDSELDREKGSTARAIDGVIPEETNFEGNRWHAALSPHPHWITIELPQPRTIARVVIHFADPTGHPIDFEGQASNDGQRWTPLFKETGYGNIRQYEKDIDPIELRYFKLTISKSSSKRYPNAAQIGEIELIAR